jgi:hypothetical protein
VTDTTVVGKSTTDDDRGDTARTVDDCLSSRRVTSERWKDTGPGSRQSCSHSRNCNYDCNTLDHLRSRSSSRRSRLFWSRCWLRWNRRHTGHSTQSSRCRTKSCSYSETTKGTIATVERWGVPVTAIPDAAIGIAVAVPTVNGPAPTTPTAAPTPVVTTATTARIDDYLATTLDNDIPATTTTASVTTTATPAFFHRSESRCATKCEDSSNQNRDKSTHSTILTEGHKNLAKTGPDSTCRFSSLSNLSSARPVTAILQASRV